MAYMDNCWGNMPGGRCSASRSCSLCFESDLLFWSDASDGSDGSEREVEARKSPMHAFIDDKSMMSEPKNQASTSSNKSSWPVEVVHPSLPYKGGYTVGCVARMTSMHHL